MMIKIIFLILMIIILYLCLIYLYKEFKKIIDEIENRILKIEERIETQKLEMYGRLNLLDKINFGQQEQINLLVDRLMKLEIKIKKVKKC